MYSQPVFTRTFYLNRLKKYASFWLSCQLIWLLIIFWDNHSNGIDKYESYIRLNLERVSWSQFGLGWTLASALQSLSRWRRERLRTSTAKPSTTTRPWQFAPTGLLSPPLLLTQGWFKLELEKFENISGINFWLALTRGSSHSSGGNPPCCLCCLLLLQKGKDVRQLLQQEGDFGSKMWRRRWWALYCLPTRG